MCIQLSNSQNDLAAFRYYRSCLCALAVCRARTVSVTRQALPAVALPGRFTRRSAAAGYRTPSGRRSPWSIHFNCKSSDSPSLRFIAICRYSFQPCKITYGLPFKLGQSAHGFAAYLKYMKCCHLCHYRKPFVAILIHLFI